MRVSILRRRALGSQGLVEVWLTFGWLGWEGGNYSFIGFSKVLDQAGEPIRYYNSQNRNVWGVVNGKLGVLMGGGSK